MTWIAIYIYEWSGYFLFCLRWVLIRVLLDGSVSRSIALSSAAGISIRLQHGLCAGGATATNPSPNPFLLSPL